MATPAVTPNTPNSPAPEAVEFSDAQQKKIDEIVRKAMGRAAQETKTQLTQAEQKIAQLEEELRKAQASVNDPNKSSKERKEAKGDVEDLQRQIEEMKNASQSTKQELESLRNKLTDAEKRVNEQKAEVLKEKKLSLITRTAQKENFVNLDTVRKLTEDSLKWDEGEQKWVVLNDMGQPRMNSAFDPMTVEEFYADFAAKNPYLVRSDAKPGAGSGPSNAPTATSGRYQVEQIFGSKSDARLANDLAMKNPKEYQRLKVEAKAKRLI